MDKVTKQLVKQVRCLMCECPKHDADEVPDWLDSELANLSLALAMYDREAKENP